MNRSIERATAGNWRRSSRPSNWEGIRSKSSAEMLTMPVTWLMSPSKQVRSTAGMNLYSVLSTFLWYLQSSLQA